jgi:hypothetical protein
LNIPNYEEYKNECCKVNDAFDEKYDNEVFETIIWDDTFEITRTKNIECKGIK